MRKIKTSAKNFRSELKEKNKLVSFTYLILRVFVILSLVLSVINGEYESAFVCILTLVLFMLPVFVEKNFKIRLPSVLEIVILLFIFAAEILGELQSYYIQYPHWDTVLHTIAGFIAAACGYGMIDMLNRKEKPSTILSPISVAIFSFCFSMTVGVLWEFFEFSIDNLFHMDMQKDTIIHSFASVSLDPTNSNIPIRVDNITDVVVNGESLGLGGYLDIGLYDTMEDLFVNFIGAFVFSIIGFFNSKFKGKSRIARQFVPVADDVDTDNEVAGILPEASESISSGPEEREEYNDNCKNTASDGDNKLKDQ